MPELESLREVADAALMEQAAWQMSQLQQADPDSWKDYVAEGRNWEEGTAEPLATPPRCR